MEINTQQLEALLHLQEQQAQFPRRNNGQAQGFESILNQQLAALDQQNGLAAHGMAEVAPASIYNRIMLDTANDNQSDDPDAAVLQAAFDQASSALALWDSYATTLGTSTTDTALKDAYALLENIGKQVEQMRDNPARGKNSTLDDIFNELEIMTTTERFKFNRGDYLL